MSILNCMMENGKEPRYQKDILDRMVKIEEEGRMMLKSMQDKNVSLEIHSDTAVMDDKPLEFGRKMSQIADNLKLSAISIVAECGKYDRHVRDVLQLRDRDTQRREVDSGFVTSGDFEEKGISTPTQERETSSRDISIMSKIADPVENEDWSHVCHL